MLTATGVHTLPDIRQSTETECGLACIAMLASYHGFETDLPDIRRRFGDYPRGMTVEGITNILAEVSFSTRSVSCSLEELGQIRLPAILHWDFNHFVVLKKVTSRFVKIHDPAVGESKISLDAARKQFTGVAIEATPNEGFQTKKAEKQLKLANLITLNRVFFSQFSLGLTISVLAELLLLAAPFYLQTVIDEVLLNGDIGLLDTLLIGFGLLVMLEVLGMTLRMLTFQFLGQNISQEMSSRIFEHIVRLPISYFRNRQLGDLQHRTQSLEQIQYFITQSAPQLIVDIVFMILIIALMCVYSIQTTVATLVVVSVYCLWRVFSFFLMRQAAGDLIIAESKTQSSLLETLRSMMSIKLQGLESHRAYQFKRNLVKKLNANIRVGNLNIANRSIGTTFLELFRVLLIYHLAKNVFAGDMTVGMLSAYVAYYGMFKVRSVGIIDRFVEYKLLVVPLARIADIVFHKPESRGLHSGTVAKPTGQVALDKVSFRYGPGEPWTLNSVSLKVKPGSLVLVRGASGSGKSTLLKLIAGIERPTSGKVLYDGVALENLNRQVVVNSCGTVLQEEQLLSGTIAQNISGFREEICMERVRECAKKARILQDINDMPMGFESVIGDLSSSLSSGQKQRIQIARALYSDASLLVLDEPTSSLDAENEASVVESILNCTATKFIVSHRDEFLEHADQVFEVANGMAIPVRGPQAALPNELVSKLWKSK